MQAIIVLPRPSSLRAPSALIALLLNFSSQCGKPLHAPFCLYPQMERVLTPEFSSLMAAAAPCGISDFDEVVRLHRGAILRFIFASLRDRAAAEELTQECLMRAWQARESFRGQASVRTWLMQIAVNGVRNHMTSSRLRFWRRTQQAALDSSVAEEWVADRQSSPEELALARQKIAAVWNIAAALPQRQRMVFLLRFVEDMDLLEIAAATGMREGTVKAQLFRAVHAVRRRIEESQ